jgi:adenylate cyclase
LNVINDYNKIKYHTSTDRIGMEPGILCHGWAGLHQNWLGYPDQARDHSQTILEIAKSYQSNLFTKDALWLSAWISLELQDATLAHKYVEELLALSIKEHYLLYEGVARIFEGRILSWKGKHKESIKNIQKGIDLYYQTGIKTFQTEWQYFLAEVYCAAGQIENGLAVVNKTEQIQQKTGEGRYKSALQRIKGDFYIQKGDKSSGENAYLKAINIAQDEKTKLFELEAVKCLAKLWINQGKLDQANQKLQEVYEWFKEGFDTPMLVEAREMLEGMVHLSQEN